MSWRNLTLQFNQRSSYRDFEVPAVLYETPRDIQVEFIRGFADASATPSKADYEQFGRQAPKLQRIVLQVNHQNWKLPIQVCRLLQVHLQVPVQHILWGHPNLRDPKGRGAAWAKEHRIRIYADAFLRVGFHFPFKQRILEDLSQSNARSRKVQPHACNPLALHRVKVKKRHKDEKSKDLPEALRGRHFDTYYQICQQMGAQGQPSDQLVLIDEP
jgi:hypothetical protein